MASEDTMAKKPVAVEDPEQDQEPGQGFDLNVWLAGATLPARTVMLSRDSGLRAEYDELEKKFLALQALVNREQERQLSSGEPDNEDQVVSDSLEAQYQVALAMQDVIGRMQEDQLTVRVRACSGDELDKIRMKFPEDADEDERILACIHVGGSVKGSPLSRKQWRELRNAVGERQFADVVRATFDVNGFGIGSSELIPVFPTAAAALLSRKD
ncbi:hypothetical protein [Flexivirga alba]|uniref:DUF222 domain-containing protein n=1 Tax=Flexivirga alba TaxID=702742 RepID=A0ABW2AL16_9MICO